MRWTAILLVLVMWGCSPPERSLDGLPCDNGECVDGWVCYEKTDTCIPANSPCNPDPCDHGTCNPTDGTCACESGWSGEACDVPADPCDPDPCADEHRICVADGDSAFCGDCLAGYHEEGGDCVEDADCQPTTCSGHGDCDDSSGAPVCTCDTGWAGDFCDTCADGYTGPDCHRDWCADNDCGVHGDCVDEACVCDTGWAGEFCDTCADGYTGPDCHRDWCADNDCGVHGDCVSEACVCDPEYSGDHCDSCADGYHDEGGECVPDCAYASCFSSALTAGETPFIQNGEESDVLFFSITAQYGPAGISAMTFEVDCPNGQVDPVEGTFYRSPDGQTYTPLTIAGEGAVARYIPDAATGRIRIGFVQEELFAEGETKYYRLSPVMSGLTAGEECSVTMLSDAVAAGPAFLYHPSQESILSIAGGVCHENPPSFIWSDLAAGADHLRPTVDFWPCNLLEGTEPQPWGSDDFIQGAMDASAITVVLTAP